MKHNLGAAYYEGRRTLLFSQHPCLIELIKLKGVIKVSAIGQRIKERRKELGLSADDLARRIGKSRATMFRYENGEIEKLSIDVAKPIAEALGLTLAALLGWEDNAVVIPYEQAQKTLNSVLSEDEIELLGLYNKADPVIQVEAKEMLRRHPKVEVMSAQQADR